MGTFNNTFNRSFNQVGSNVNPPANEAEVDTYITGLVTPLSSGQIRKLNTFVSALKSGLSITNLSDAFDVIYLLKNETSESGLRNIVKRQHDATMVNNPIFIENIGFKGVPLNEATINTNYNPALHSVRYKLNDACIGIYSRTILGVHLLRCEVGASLTNPRLYLQLMGFSNGFYARINDNAGGADLLNENTVGLACACRTSSNNIDVYMNKNKIGEIASNSTTIAANNISIFSGGTEASLSDFTCSLMFAGKSMSQAEVNVINDAFTAYEQYTTTQISYYYV